MSQRIIGSSRTTTASAAAQLAPWWQGKTEEEIIATLANWKREDGFSQFLRWLEQARGIWRKYPALIESPEIPEPFAAAFREVLGQVSEQPDFDDVFAADYPEKLLQSARESARSIKVA